MALLIKGRKMPKACVYCMCNDDSYRCGATGDGLDIDQWDIRMPNCPLVEIPDEALDDFMEGYQRGSGFI